ncbi:MurR/RpiR family transcriptional regulator [Paenibacillus sp. TRM 82003]|uniref:MurR/RpiR family transcriptional regulator n=1 Tax=Kineococcus sp. TRM81007 TaxID=2925831 RepID=UPI001F58ECAA|nr:MurR/RpiR family transcriptional regulator [Kineococcus sp. TRM81007]MCI2237525.1 MurR/RpiR family transcriptional regulator [Kineococcus sp. TRM81007]MCI3919879.1 MurR/RpiR family transcriptional regulator [Paenibacillus sp. TRM 82003]
MPPPDAPPAPGVLRAHLLAAVPAATASAARVLRVLLDDPGAAHLTVTDVAGRAGTSEASVVRTARSLGFAGYPQLRLALAAAGGADAADAAEPVALLTGDLTEGGDLTAVVATLAALEREAVTATVGTLDVGVLAAAAEAVAAARVVDCYGVGVSALVARHADLGAARLGLVSRLRTEPHAALVSSALLRPGDVALVVSHSGRTREVLAAARRAGERGAGVVAITGSATSPLARCADHVLVAAGRETAYRAGATAGRASALFLADCLHAAVAQRLGGEAVAALRETHRAVGGQERVR